MSNHIGDPGHGHSPAAWTAVVIMLVAVTLGTVFFFLDMPALVWASAGLLLIGLIVGWAMILTRAAGDRAARASIADGCASAAASTAARGRSEARASAS